MSNISRNAVVFLLAFISVSSFSQSRFFLYSDWYKKRNYFEIGASTGLMNCKTDIGKHGLWLNAPGFSFNNSVYAGYNSLDRWGIRLEYTLGSLESADSYIKYVDKDSAKLRNLSFKSTINEVTLIGEIFPWNWAFLKVHDNFLNPYVLAGIGWFHFNPTTEYQGSTIELRPLHLDGQGFPEYPERKPYKLNALCIPFGGGILVNVDDVVNVRAEFIYRETNTDYLDDVHEARTNTALFDKNLPQEQAELAHLLYIRRGEIDPKSDKQTGPRGNPSNDGYYTFNIKLGIRLMGQRKKRVL